MRIALVYPHFNSTGGIERCVYELARHFAGSHEVHVFASSRDPDLLAQHPNVTFRHVPLPLRRPRFLELACFAISSSLSVRRRDFDIVHVQGGPIFAGRCHLITAQSVHRIGIDQALASQASSWARARIWLRTGYPFVIPFLEWCMRRAQPARITALSRRVAGELVEAFGFPPDRITVIPNGVNLEEFTPLNRSRHRAAVRERLGIGASDRVVLFVGKEFRRKGLAALIRAIQVMNRSGPSCRLVVVGENCETYPDPSFYENLVRSLGLTEQVNFVGHSAAVQAYMAAADLFALPTLYEPFGLVVAEAMASGLPVVVSRVAGVSEYIKSVAGPYLLEDPTNAQEIADKMTLAFGAGSALQEAVVREAAQFAWPNVAAQFLSLYHSILHN